MKLLAKLTSLPRAATLLSLVALGTGSALAAPPLPDEVRMTCQQGSKTYWVSYDFKQKVFKTNNAEAGSTFRIKKDQNDAEGVLVWVGAAHLGGERDLLAFFGNQEKWVRQFYGNGSQVVDRCR